MPNFYIIRSNQYAKMAEGFYTEYLEAKRFCEKISKLEVKKENANDYYANLMINVWKRDESAIAAVLFQALAVEAYLNLLGITLFGEKKYYKRIEQTGIETKYKKIEEKLGQPLPKELTVRIDRLFEKRKNFVHQKPKAYRIGLVEYDYSNPEESFEDIDAYMKELAYAEENIEDDMGIYRDLQESVRVLRGAELELTAEYKHGFHQWHN